METTVEYYICVAGLDLNENQIWLPTGLGTFKSYQEAEDCIKQQPSGQYSIEKVFINQ